MEKKQSIKGNYIVEKLNLLNEFRPDNMSFQELRFFCIYLAKINARDVSTRVVRFSRAEFMKAVGAEVLNIDYLKEMTTSLMRKLIRVPLESGGFKMFQFFKKCKVDKDENSEWFFDLDAHDDALPLMFEFKKRYFTYEIWNILFLKSVNQIRMYEILKQYERIGERTIPLSELRELLGVGKDEHTRFNNFKVEVLDVCKTALSMSTDICFSYEPIRGKGRGGKITEIKFKIYKNENFTAPTDYPMFVKEASEFDDIPDTANYVDDDVPESNFENDRLEFLAEACSNEFSEAEMHVLYNLSIRAIPRKVHESIEEYDLRLYDYLKFRHDEFNAQAMKKEIKYRFSYFKKILAVYAEIAEKQQNN